jgi:hypothetical protein
MLTFISFWRAAAIVLNDMGSSAFYAGAIAEHFVGNTGPWFILAIMLLAYAVRSVYIESCSMFVRGGVYRVVKEAMGSTLAKFSVSALMFDYILTGPISGVSAGLYLVGLLNELLHYFHVQTVLPAECHRRVLRRPGHSLFLVGKYQGCNRVQRKGSAHHVRDHRDGGRDAGWCGYTLYVRGVHLPPFPFPRNLTFAPDALGLAKAHQPALHRRPDRHFDRLGSFRSGHERRRDHGPGLSRNGASQAPQPGKSGLRDFRLQPDFHRGRGVFRRHDHSRLGPPEYFDNPIGGLAMYMVGPLTLRWCSGFLW